MPFLQARNDQLPPLTQETTSFGANSTLGENFSALYNQQWRVDATFALEGELSERFEENERRLAELAGDDPFNYVGYGPFSVLVRKMTDQDPYAWKSREDVDKTLATFAKRDARIQELKEQFPDLKTSEEIFQEVVQLRQEVMQEAGEVSQSAGFFGTLAGFAGGIAGSFTMRDPLNVFTLGWGGVGRNIAMRIASEVGVGAGIEAVNQFGFVQRTQEALGEEGTDPLLSIAFAGVGAGVLRGAAEGASPAFRATEQALFPSRARARMVRDTLEENLNVPLEQLVQRMQPARLSDEALLDAVRKLPPSPNVRGAQFGLEQGIELARLNPYGQGVAAQQRLAREIDLTQRLFNGEDVPANLRTDTAVGRFIDGQEVDLPQTPARAQGRMEMPELYNRFDVSEARLREVETRLQDTEIALNSRTMGDAVSLVDEVSGARVKAIEAEMDQQIPATRRQELERELDQIVESIGPDLVSQAEREWRIGPQRQLRDLRKSRQAAKKDYNRYLRSVTEVESRFERQAQIEAALREPTEMEHYYPGPTQASALARTLDAVEPERETMVDSIVERNAPTPARAEGETVVEEPSPIPEGMVDVGDGTYIPADFEVPIEVDGRTLSARAILADLNEDTKMLEAMRTCAL